MLTLCVYSFNIRLRNDYTHISGGDMMSFLNVKDVQRILNVKQATAYEVIRKLNAQLTMQGYQVVRGRVDKSYFEKSYLYSDSREKVTG